MSILRPWNVSNDRFAAFFSSRRDVHGHLWKGSSAVLDTTCTPHPLEIHPIRHQHASCVSLIYTNYRTHVPIQRDQTPQVIVPFQTDTASPSPHLVCFDDCSLELDVLRHAVPSSQRTAPVQATRQAVHRTHIPTPLTAHDTGRAVSTPAPMRVTVPPEHNRCL